MAVDNLKVVDGLGVDKERNELVLLITDDLSWEKDYEHLAMLQKKINTYAAYIKAKQYTRVYPDEHFDSFLIEIHLKYEMPELCQKFLDKIRQQMKAGEIRIHAEVVE